VALGQTEAMHSNPLNRSISKSLFLNCKTFKWYRNTCSLMSRGLGNLENLILIL